MNIENEKLSDEIFYLKKELIHFIEKHYKKLNWKEYIMSSKKGFGFLIDNEFGFFIYKECQYCFELFICKKSEKGKIVYPVEQLTNLDPVFLQSLYDFLEPITMKNKIKILNNLIKKCVNI